MRATAQETRTIPQLLTKAEACKILCCGHTFLDSLIANGELVTVHCSRRKVLVTAQSITDFIERRTHN